MKSLKPKDVHHSDHTVRKEIKCRWGETEVHSINSSWYSANYVMIFRFSPLPLISFLTVCNISADSFVVCREHFLCLSGFAVCVSSVCLGLLCLFKLSVWVCCERFSCLSVFVVSISSVCLSLPWPFPLSVWVCRARLSCLSGFAVSVSSVCLGLSWAIKLSVWVCRERFSCLSGFAVRV